MARLTQALAQAAHLGRPKAVADFVGVLDGVRLSVEGSIGWRRVSRVEQLRLLLTDPRVGTAAVPDAPLHVHGDAGRLGFSGAIRLESESGEVWLEPGVGYRLELIRGANPNRRMRRVALIAGGEALDDTGPTLANPPSPRSGASYVPHLARDHPVRIEMEVGSSHAEVRRVDPGIDRLSLVCHLVGPRDRSSVAWSAVFVRRDRAATISADAVVDRGDVVIEVPLAVLIEASEPVTIWDTWLEDDQGSRLRIGRCLSDLRDPQSVYRYPFVTSRFGGDAWRILPYYTRSRQMALRATRIDG